MEKNDRRANRALLKRYRSSLTWFCCYLAEMQRFAELKKRGVEPPKKKVVYATAMAERYMKYLLEDKAALGYEDDLEFLGDNRFDGFAIVGGALEGDRNKVAQIVGKWIKGFPTTSDNYEFEVAVYALALGFSEQKKGLYPEALEGGRRMAAAA